MHKLLFLSCLLGVTFNLYGAKNFSSDGNAAVHPNILRAIEAANRIPGQFSQSAFQKAAKSFSDLFGQRVAVFYVATKTGANVLALKALVKSHEAVIAADTAHLHNFEAGAFENFCGAKIITVPSHLGKITSQGIKKHIESQPSLQSSSPRVVSISQPTELGLVYTVPEIKELAHWAHAHKMYLHVDGSRIAHAVATLNVSIADMTFNAGVDALSFGGSKNAMLFGEAIIFSPAIDSRALPLIQRQGMQRVAKSKFIAAQYEAYLKNNLWIDNARIANHMAVYLSEQLKKVKGVRISYPVQSNMVFAQLPAQLIELSKKWPKVFYLWRPHKKEARFLTSYQTTISDVDQTVAMFQQSLW